MRYGLREEEVTLNKKILVLSVSSWNSKVGADTWPMLLNHYEPSSVASLSLRDDYPDSDVAKHYFVISENRVMKSIFNRKLVTGHVVGEIQSKQELDDLASQNKRYGVKKHELVFRILREFVWKFGKWKSKELRDFIDNFQPDILLYSMEGYIHLNRICMYVKKYSHAKSIGFFWDDNFTYKQSNEVLHCIFRFFQRKSLRKLAANTDAFWAITDMTKREADAFFNIDCTVLTKPLRTTPVYLEAAPHKPLQILYTGNLQIGRDASLVKVVNALRKVNEKQVEFEVHVYTKTVLEPTVLNQLSCEFCHIHEAIPQAEVLEMQRKADILLFLEDVDGKYAHKARLSFSTKITDYLCAAKCIFAVGCLDTAPMQYFDEYDAAIIAATEKDIADKFRTLADNPEKLNEYAKRACICAIKNHDKKKIHRIVDETIDKVMTGA